MLHLVVRSHPGNGLPSVFVTPIYTETIQGMSNQESDAVLGPCTARQSAQKISTGTADALETS